MRCRCWIMKPEYFATASFVTNLEDNMDMTVKEAQALKRKLEEKIGEALRRFSKKTGIEVREIKLMWEPMYDIDTKEKFKGQSVELMVS